MFEPAILSTSCSGWRSSPIANERERAERKTLSEVRAYLEYLGFDVAPDRPGHLSATIDHPYYGVVTVGFAYYESATNVHKGLSVTRGGKKSNLDILRKIKEHKAQLP